MKKVFIKDLCKLRYGKALKKENRKDGSIPVYGSNGIVGYHDKSFVNKMTIIIGRKGSIGEVHLVKVPSWPIDTTYFVDFKVQNINIEWFYRILKTLRLNELNRSAAIPGLNRDDVYRIKIHRPPLNDQSRIVTLLNRVEALIATRKDILRLLDEFLKSTFLEMFGDPVRNEKGWDKPELKNNFGEISTGNTPPRSNAENYSPAFIEWIKTDNIDQDYMYLTPATEFLSRTGVKKARMVNKGALLVVCIAGSIESIGRAALANRKVAFNQQINAIQPNADINSLFLYWLFRICRIYIQSFAPRGMKKIITKGNFEKIMMIKPPKNLQDQFATIVKKSEILKTLYQQNLTDLESLYCSLSQKAFKDELDLSRIPLEETVTDTTPEIADQFPEPDSYAMADPVARENLLRQLFDIFIEERKGYTFSMEAFWTQVEQKVFEHMDDESPPLGVMDYDKVREWLFELLKSGRVRQQFYEVNNYIGLSIKR